MKITRFKLFVLIFFYFGLTVLHSQTVKDISGNIYNTVTIGTQTWMKEDLKTTKYRNGDPISNVTDNKQWSELTTGAYCDYNNTPAYRTAYGRLYNWYAVDDSRNLCPTGWHVPTDAEWSTLLTYLGDVNIAGGKLKDSGQRYWNSPNTGADNSSGFTALPNGYRFNDGGDFDEVGYKGNWWSSTAYDSKNAKYKMLAHNEKKVFNLSYDKSSGFSVRCLLDK